VFTNLDTDTVGIARDLVISYDLERDFLPYSWF